ncbi:M48 family metallopeptidase [Glycomyces tritici]|uniref:M48 family metallopeptidase n=1 Tax=Glycomyces tritici TaxID=2665176 RepID=A0ABT7YK77_9ACTN|nr:M48 family metallopeptidase [Glycomyces tritici]MDN3239038.1 M48 family metallopeptidase [Glycomyces tritici]MDN3240200.1 M48 family metallopeptidase [Glycomyces tritici]
MSEDQSPGERGPVEARDQARGPVILRGISTRAWEHPADRGALVALRELRGFDIVLRKVSGMVSERALRLSLMGSSIRVDRHQYSRVYEAYQQVGAVLDASELPELYITRDPDLGGMCIGIDKPVIVINSGSIELLDDAELKFLLAHELGHALSGHGLYRTLLMVLVRLTTSVAWIPVGVVGLRVITAALYEWSRKSELSADRAGVLAVQDPAAAIRVMAKLAGGGDLHDVDTAAFLEQAKEFETGGDLRDSFLKLMLLEQRSHDFAVARAAAVKSWIDDGEYREYLAGDYPKREDDKDASIAAEAKAAANSYRHVFQTSGDPLAKVLRKVREGF